MIFHSSVFCLLFRFVTHNFRSFHSRITYCISLVCMSLERQKLAHMRCDVKGVAWNWIKYIRTVNTTRMYHIIVPTYSNRSILICNRASTKVNWKPKVFLPASCFLFRNLDGFLLADLQQQSMYVYAASRKYAEEHDIFEINTFVLLDLWTGGLAWAWANICSAIFAEFVLNNKTHTENKKMLRITLRTLRTQQIENNLIRLVHTNGQLDTDNRFDASSVQRINVSRLFKKQILQVRFRVGFISCEDANIFLRIGVSKIFGVY